MINILMHAHWIGTIIYLITTLGGHPILCQSDEDLHTSNDTILESLYITEDSEHKCQEMSIPFCQDMLYKNISLPNEFGHKEQKDVIQEINIYTVLHKANCSTDLKLFLCSLYAPICFDHGNGSKPLTMPPCRSLCESARQGCSETIKQYNRQWPERFNCSKFPVKTNESVICMPGNEANNNYKDYELENDHTLVPTRELGFVCPKNFEVPSYKLHLFGKIYNNCALPCDDVWIDKTSSETVQMATCVLALICILSTTLIDFTFLINQKRFEYPTRPIVTIAFCQLVVASCYLIGFMTSRQISCNDPVEPPRYIPNLRMVRTTTMGNKKGSCTLQFMGLYFFQMSTMFWWVMMTISWYMIARLKWAPEAVSSVSKYFHLVSWTIPAFLTIYLSVLGNIEGDSLSGTCYVNFSDQESIRMFVIYPTLACLIVGCFFLCSGFKSIWDHRKVLRREYGKQADEHYKLVVRIGLFSFLFLTFAAMLIYCHHNEQNNLNSWMSAWLSNICRNREYGVPCPIKDFSKNSPHYSVFILKYTATLGIGIISSIFIISEKTLSDYRKIGELFM